MNRTIKGVNIELLAASYRESHGYPDWEGALVKCAEYFYELGLKQAKMLYKEVKKMTRPNGTKIKNYGIAITGSSVTFCRGFVVEYGIKKHVVYVEDAEGYLCFSLKDEKGLNTYSIYKGQRGVYSSRLPRVIQGRAEPMKYDVRQEGDWFITNCKLKIC